LESDLQPETGSTRTASPIAETPRAEAETVVREIQEALAGTIDEAQRATRRLPSDDQGKITTALDEFKAIASKIKSEWLAP